MSTPRRLLGNAPTVNGWRLLRVEYPAARAAAPGQWLRLALESGNIDLAVSHAAEDWLGLLAPPPLEAQLAELRPHSQIRVSELQGDAFDLDALTHPPLVLASDAGIPAALFLIERLPAPPRLVLLGGAVPPPFRPVPSQFLLAGMPPAVTAAAPMLESQGIASRLAQHEERPGCFEGSAVALLELWQASQPRGMDILASIGGEEAAALQALAQAQGHRLQIIPPPSS